MVSVTSASSFRSSISIALDGGDEEDDEVAFRPSRSTSLEEEEVEVEEEGNEEIFSYSAYRSLMSKFSSGFLSMDTMEGMI